MSISFVQGATAGGTSATLGAAAVAGDLILVTVWRNASTAQPTIPSGAGWNTLFFVTGTTCCLLVVWKIAAGGETATGAFTSASNVSIETYRTNITGGNLALGTVGAASVASSATATMPALTCSRQDSASWVRMCFGSKTTTVLSTATVPSGLTKRTATTSGGGLFTADTNGGVNSIVAKTVTQTANAYIGQSYEILELPPCVFPIDFTTATFPAELNALGGTNGSRVNSSGNLVTGQSAPRFDYTPAGVARGLLIEPAAASMSLKSSDKSDTGNWQRNNCSYTTGTGTGAGGATTLATITANAGSYTFATARFAGDNLGTTGVTLRWALKYINCQYIWIRDDYNSPNVWVCFDLVNNVVAGVLDTNSKLISSGMIQMANGVWECWMKVAPSSNGAGYYSCLQFGNGATPTGGNITKAGTEQVYVDYFDAQTGGPTTYIEVNAASVARPAEVIPLTLPAATTSLIFTFDDNTTQTITGLTGGAIYTVPTSLNRARVKTIDDPNRSSGAHLAASAAAVATGVAALDVQHHLAATAQGQAAAAALLRVQHHLAAAATAIASASAGLRLSRHLAAAGAALSSATADLDVQHHLGAIATAASTAAAALDVVSGSQVHLSAAGAARAAATATLDLQHHLSAAGNAAANAYAGIDVQHHLAAAAQAVVAASANLETFSTPQHLSADGQALASAVATLRAHWSLSASGQVVSTVTATLRPKVQPDAANVLVTAVGVVDFDKGPDRLKAVESRPRHYRNRSETLH